MRRAVNAGVGDGELGRVSARFPRSARVGSVHLQLCRLNMNVMINSISRDLHTDVAGVQTTITLFLLIMAVLMIPCSKLTDQWAANDALSVASFCMGSAPY
jgi:hypothetical protein